VKCALHTNLCVYIVARCSTKCEYKSTRVRTLTLRFLKERKIVSRALWLASSSTNLFVLFLLSDMFIFIFIFWSTFFISFQLIFLSLFFPFNSSLPFHFSYLIFLFTSFLLLLFFSFFDSLVLVYVSPLFIISFVSLLLRPDDGGSIHL
jgi:hypothetical protein